MYNKFLIGVFVSTTTHLPASKAVSTLFTCMINVPSLHTWDFSIKSRQFTRLHRCGVLSGECGNRRARGLIIMRFDRTIIYYRTSAHSLAPPAPSLSLSLPLSLLVTSRVMPIRLKQSNRKAKHFHLIIANHAHTIPISLYIGLITGKENYKIATELLPRNYYHASPRVESN